MTTAAIDALRSDHHALVGLASTFTAEDWAAPSACDGWSVQGLVGHMTQLFRLVTDPGSLPEADPRGTERTQDRYVEALRGLPAAQLLDDYRTVGEEAIVALGGIQEIDAPMDLGDLGTHPMHLTANAFAFDHYTHIRVDLLAPTGPLGRHTPITTEVHLDAAADGIPAALPQSSPEAVVAPIELVLTGPAGRTTHLGPDGHPVATVTSSIDDLVRWSTGRASWTDLDVKVIGDEAAGAHFCESVHVA